MRRGLVAIVVVLWTVTAGYAQGTGARISQIEKSGFPQVSAYISITDAGGRPISGLQQTQFTVTEDGQLVNVISFQIASGQGTNTILVMDHSGSMGDQGKITGAKQAATTFVGLMRDQDRTALVAFDTLISHLVTLTNDKDRLKGAISSLSPGSSTALYDAIYEALDEVRPIIGRRAVIALTDGLNNASRRSMDTVVRYAQDYNIPIYTIGLGSDVDQNSLEQIATQTGGVYRFAPSVNELDALYRLIQQQMQGEYVLAYKSPRPVQDGLRRQVQVRVADVQGANMQADGSYLPGAVLGTEPANPLIFVGLLLPLLFLLAVPSMISLILSPQPSQPAFPIPVVSPTNGASTAPPVAVPNLACPYCGRSLRAGARFCPYCARPVGGAPVAGAPTSNPVVPPGNPCCPQCGAPVRVGAKFCGKCRHRLS